MKEWYLKLLHLQKPYHRTRNIVSILRLAVIIVLMIAAIALTLMKDNPVLAWVLIVIVACTGIVLITVVIHYDIKNRKQIDQFWEDQIIAQEDRNSPKT